MSDTWADTIKSMFLYNNPAHKNHHYPTLTDRSLKKKDYLRNPWTHYFLKNILKTYLRQLKCEYLTIVKMPYKYQNTICFSMLRNVEEKFLPSLL